MSAANPIAEMLHARRGSLGTCAVCEEHLAVGVLKDTPVCWSCSPTLFGGRAVPKVLPLGLHGERYMEERAEAAGMPVAAYRRKWRAAVRAYNKANPRPRNNQTRVNRRRQERVEREATNIRLAPAHVWSALGLTLTKLDEAKKFRIKVNGLRAMQGAYIAPRDLAKPMGCSVTSVRRALQFFLDEGLVKTKRGLGPLILYRTTPKGLALLSEVTDG